MEEYHTCAWQLLLTFFKINKIQILKCNIKKNSATCLTAAKFEKTLKTGRSFWRENADPWQSPDIPFIPMMGEQFQVT